MTHGSELSTSVREALPSDAQRIASLGLQLGYEVPLAHVQRFMETLRESEALFVAVVPRVGVMGWISVAESHTVTSSTRAEVHGLVVEDEFRGHGIGRALVAAAEAWARRRGCTTLRLLSNVIRERAHDFYRDLGYDVLKTEHVFQKTL